MRLPCRGFAGCSGDLVNYRASFKGAFNRLIEGRFRADRRYLDVCGTQQVGLVMGLVGLLMADYGGL